MFGKLVDLEAQPAASKRNALSPLSFRNVIDKNNHGRPMIRWRRLRPVLKEAGKNILRKSPSNKSNSTAMTKSASSSSTLDSSLDLAQANPLRFLEEACPPDVLPLVLAYAGPQKAAVLQRTNRHWKKVLEEETTWKIMCQELYKWNEGDAEPHSWKEFYRMSPCVPVDYPDLESALRLAAPRPSRRPQQNRQVRSVRVLLRPGSYHLTEGIHVHSPPGVSVSVESIRLPSAVRWYRSNAPTPPQREAPERALPQRTSSRTLFQMLRCASRLDFSGNGAAEEPTENCSESDDASNSVWNLDEDSPYEMVAVVPPTRAMVSLRSRRMNEPMFRVRQGKVLLKNLDLDHSCYGTDIWNGCAAIQVQPPPSEEEEPEPLSPLLRPRASINGCRIKSRSGRGVVNIDGGHVDVDSCFIAGCAATGLYVGGPGSSAYVERTDVFKNGRGNPRRRGIARGHSGVYLEQGKATLHNCMVAGNTLTGISSVSHEKAFLTLTDSTVAQNGTNQMELPPLGTPARNQSVIDNNQLDRDAHLVSRSGLMKAV